MTISEFLSTLSLRRATSDALAAVSTLLISIHALLAESDASMRIDTDNNSDFYPRSPCGERRILTISICTALKFLSTLSLRRATSMYWIPERKLEISIHALLAESDRYTNNIVRVVRGISIHALLAESDTAVP